MKTKSSPLVMKLRSELKRTRRQRDEAKQATYDDIELYASMEKELAEKEREAETLRQRILELEASQMQAGQANATKQANMAEEFKQLNTRIGDLTEKEAVLLRELNDERQAAAKLRTENVQLGELLAEGMRQLAEMHDAIALLQRRTDPSGGLWGPSRFHPRRPLLLLLSR